MTRTERAALCWYKGGSALVRAPRMGEVGTCNVLVPEGPRKVTQCLLVCWKGFFFFFPLMVSKQIFIAMQTTSKSLEVRLDLRMLR